MSIALQLWWKELKKGFRSPLSRKKKMDVLSHGLIFQSLESFGNHLAERVTLDGKVENGLNADSIRLMMAEAGDILAEDYTYYYTHPHNSSDVVRAYPDFPAISIDPEKSWGGERILVMTDELDQNPEPYENLVERMGRYSTDFKVHCHLCRIRIEIGQEVELDTISKYFEKIAEKKGIDKSTRTAEFLIECAGDTAFESMEGVRNKQYKCNEKYHIKMDMSTYMGSVGSDEPNILTISIWAKDYDTSTEYIRRFANEIDDFLTI